MLIININEFKHEEARKIFVNLPVKELNKSVEFFTNLGLNLIQNSQIRILLV